MQRDPKFIQNKDKFFGTGPSKPVKSQSSAKSKLSHAQKLDNFIQKE